MAIALTVLGCGGFFTLLQFLIQRHDSRKDSMKEVKEALEKNRKETKDELNEIRKELRLLDEKGDRREAVNCRVRILRFMDELLEDRKHTKESFEQVLSDITVYNAYCDLHPGFKNEQTIATVAHIRKIYAERLEKHDFA